MCNRTQCPMKFASGWPPHSPRTMPLKRNGPQTSPSLGQWPMPFGPGLWLTGKVNVNVNVFQCNGLRCNSMPSNAITSNHIIIILWPNATRPISRGFPNDLYCCLCSFCARSFHPLPSLLSILRCGHSCLNFFFSFFPLFFSMSFCPTHSLSFGHQWHRIYRSLVSSNLVQIPTHIADILKVIQSKQSAHYSVSHVMPLSVTSSSSKLHWPFSLGHVLLVNL